MYLTIIRKNFFWTLLQYEKLDKVWFTEILTHGLTEFYNNSIDPSSLTLRYHPHFPVLSKNGTYTIVEVKSGNMMDDEVVTAKSDYATQLASASKMNYKIIKGSDAMNGVGLSTNY